MNMSGPDTGTVVQTRSVLCFPDICTDADPDSADPDSALFVSDLKDANKKSFFFLVFFCLLLFKGKFT